MSAGVAGEETQAFLAEILPKQRDMTVAGTRAT